MREKITRVIEGYNMETYNKKYGFLFNKHKLCFFDHREDLEPGKEYWLIDGKYYEIAKLTKKKRIALIGFICAIAIALAITVPIVVIKHKQFSHFTPIPEDTMSQTIGSDESTAYYSLNLKNYLTHNQSIEYGVTYFNCDQPSYELSFSVPKYNPQLNNVSFNATLIKKSSIQLNAITEVNTSFGIKLSCISDGKVDWSEDINGFTVKFKISEDKKYFIESSIDHGKIEGPMFITSGTTAEFTLISNDYYDLPEQIIVSNASLIKYDNKTGLLEIQNPTDNVIINGTCTPKIYSISSDGITNGVLDFGQDDNKISAFDEKTFYLKPNDNYYAPYAIEVVGAQYTYSVKDNVGKIKLSNPTQDVSIIANCTGQPFKILDAITNGHLNGPKFITTDESVTLYVVADDGKHLPTEVYVEGLAPEGDIIYDPQTGELTLSNPLSDVTVYGYCKG